MNRDTPSPLDKALDKLRTYSCCIGMSRSAEETASHKRKVEEAEAEVRSLFAAKIEQIKEMSQEIRDTARGAAEEATWAARQGDDYGAF